MPPSPPPILRLPAQPSAQPSPATSLLSLPVHGTWQQEDHVAPITATVLLRPHPSSLEIQLQNVKGHFPTRQHPQLPAKQRVLLQPTQHGHWQGGISYSDTLFMDVQWNPQDQELALIIAEWCESGRSRQWNIRSK